MSNSTHTVQLADARRIIAAGHQKGRRDRPADEYCRGVRGRIPARV